MMRYIGWPALWTLMFTALAGWVFPALVGKFSESAGDWLRNNRSKWLPFLALVWAARRLFWLWRYAVVAAFWGYLVSITERRYSSRWDTWAPAMCRACGWAGPGRWATHGYEDDGTGEDVEPMDYCPNCGTELWA